MDWNSKALSTRCVHAGETDDAFGSPRTPLYTTTTFKFPSTADLLDVIEGRKPGGLYTRYGMNPTITAAEAKLASIENSEAALMFASGMAAISALFLAYGRRGIVCVGNLYGGTQELLLGQLPQLGVATHWVSAAERNRLPSLLHSGVGLVFCETPANPTLDIMDLAELAQLAHGNGAVLAVDNTFASPVNQQPLALGADLSVYSATKSLGGHLTGFLTPVAVWHAIGVSLPEKQMTAMVAGGVFGIMCTIGLAMLLARRLGDPRIRASGTPMDVFLLLLLLAQVVLGLAGIPISAQHPDGAVMLKFMLWAQRIVTFRGEAAALVADVSIVFKLHMVLGLTLFLVFPFTRLVHIWSGFASVLYLIRPYQLMRSRGGSR